MPFMQQDPRHLVWQQNDRYLWIEPWGENSLRVRSGRHLPVMRNEDWALTEPVAESQCHIDYEHHQATLTNGKIIAIVNQKGQVTFYRHPHKPLLQEFWRLRGEIGEDESSHGQYVSALNLEGREFRPIQGGKYSLKARFEATEGEKFMAWGSINRPTWISKDACLSWRNVTPRPQYRLCSPVWATDFYGTTRQSDA
ncbi:hypothetical protein MUB72_002698 [Salmonella enterica]|nr:hypothetical protein [Salmonella enterica]EKC3913947.1 hypothetical protein [Salmonella enterica subsp. enterica]EGG9404744.1 hypothetical protein [Salmonella enterica]EJB2142857.1 hypothetical protein [Salmonella enterica]EJH8990619.1 hypothetical protein [Salmonella enterica]